MCGIAAYLGAPGGDVEELIGSVGRMTQALRHRGPDDAGLWADPAAGVALGHRRLAILDLSPAGHQPMTSGSGRYVLAFNGEVYNHEDLRRRLGSEAPNWRGHSDTETLLAAIDVWGLRQALSVSIGMFALVLWDRSRQEMTIVRDRLGEKPAYLGRGPTGWIVSSELRAIRTAWRGQLQLDPEAVGDLLRYDFVGSPHTICRHVWKVPAGCLVVLNRETREPLVERWWSITAAAASGRRTPPVNEAEIVDCIEDRLTASVGRQLRHTDVPIGVFLSGGIDSSLIAALAARSTVGVRTFSIGFAEQEYDESSAASAVAAHLGTSHTTTMVSGTEAAAALVDLLPLLDEPMADPSMLPTYLVSRMARNHVTVALSGDGADELFGGYNRYLWLPGALRAAGRVPAGLRRPLGQFAWSSPRVLSGLSRRMGLAERVRTPTEKARKLGALLAARDLPSVASWPAQGVPPRPLPWATSPYLTAQLEEEMCALDRALPGLTRREVMMLTDARHYLPDDVLTKVDRASMAVGLETRAPFLDLAVVDAAMSIPDSLRVRDGRGKHVLRSVLARYVPRELWDRPKMGFAVPLAAWLRGPLQEWAGDVLQSSSLVASGQLPADSVRQLWLEHLSGRVDHQRALWPLLVLESWVAQGLDAPAGEAPPVELAAPYFRVARR